MRNKGALGTICVIVVVMACAEPSRQPEAAPVAAGLPTATFDPAPVPPASTNEPPAAAPAAPIDVAKEIAWARASYEKDLAQVSFESLAARLEAWVPAKGELAVYLSSDNSACEKVLLSRFVPDEPTESDASASDSEGEGDPTQAHLVIGKVGIQETSKGGVRERSYGSATFGYFYETHSGGGSERFENGHWVPGMGWGIGDPPVYHGTLSRVDEGVAVYGGVPARARVDCDGPIEKWQCPSGGQRDCDTCQRSRLEVEPNAPSAMGMIGLIGVASAAQCKDVCPEHVPPDKLRIEALFDATPAWMPAQSDEPPPALYKSRQRCLSARKQQKQRPAATPP